MNIPKGQNPVEPDPEDPTQIPMFDPDADLIDTDDEDVDDFDGDEIEDDDDFDDAEDEDADA